ncbi:hypothetical protein FB567DRAFT_438523 [Paraphoma chrysanthemicola]|uniref:C2H2-type domain-containing protein n=1 Tax=Paraphoma chrysanthemicola TaxID=798071 RepID=A0A8K0R8H5_9PLEO|nr:hypothetical protein FB567DRAFT_438523 [Paraphoma chrysanthemicola]
MCAQSFTSKAELTYHTENHAENSAPQLHCESCKWPFDDELALETHKISTGHGSSNHKCDDCGETYSTSRGLQDHKMRRPGCQKAFAGVTSTQSRPTTALIRCDRCQDDFKTRREYNHHRSYKVDGPCADHNQKGRSKHRGNYIDPDQPNNFSNNTLGYDDAEQDSSNDSGSDAPSNLTVGKEWCGKCKSKFDSLAQYHGHFLRCKSSRWTTKPPAPASTRGRNRGGRGATSAARPPIPVFHPAPPPQFTPVHPQVQPASGSRMPPHTHTPAHHVPSNGQPVGRHMGDNFDMEQAHHIKDKILRLLIQSDILIHHDGKMTVGGIDWTRIGCSRQADVVGMFDGMCHLPKVLQGEYLPPPKALQDQYNVQYPASEFEPSPDRDRYKPGLGVVALTCSRVVLPDGLQEVVKIAAVDLVTCRILMDYLVCTDPSATVANWRSNETGLFTWNDMEQARLNGFKVLKGWSAARAALWKFIDKETIIVGHNLRSDLDSLRMIHGRAVDIAKVAEKAANGPLSKIQVGLDSLCRDYPKVTLTSDPNYGRDVLMNVFAVREMGLWIIKNKDTFEQKLRQKSMDYQRLVPRMAAV